MNRFLGVLLASSILAGCSGTPEQSPFVGWYKGYASCRDEYAQMDARVAKAGVGDPTYHRVPGFPYLRTDRTTASFAHEVQGLEQTFGWVRRMREFDQEAREFEYRNLGMSMQEAAIQRFRFLDCGRTLAGIELEDPAVLAHLRNSVSPPDEYSGVARALGAYPLMVPLLRSRLASEHAAVKQDFSRPLPELDAGGPLELWMVNPQKEPELAAEGFKKVIADELGFPGLTDSRWQSLAERHAPALWIETASERDRPGTPVWTDAGVGVDLDKPWVNFTIGFARFGGQPVAQFTYFFWFRGANAQQPIDGLVWRVSLDMQANVIAYESLHASGRNHYWFPVQPLERRAANGYWQQPRLFPQEQVPAEQPVLRLRAGTHAVRRVLTSSDAAGTPVRPYELRRYEDLNMLPLPKGGTRSLFAPDGSIPGTQGDDPVWLWSSGVRNPGVLKQYAHLTPAYVGREHFDAPYLLESVLVPPQTPARLDPD